MSTPAISLYAIEPDLVLKIKAGDTRAFEQLYHQFSPRLYLNILKMVKDELTAEELIQELFTKIWQKREELDNAVDFLPYLYRTAQNLVYDFFRKLQRDRKMMEHYKSIATENYEHIEAALNYKESEHLLKTALEKLSPQQRSVYLFCKIQGYTYKQAAEKMGISPHTVKEYLSKANQSVKVYLLSNMDITFGLFLLAFLYKS